MSVLTRVRFNDGKGGFHSEFITLTFACPPRSGDTFVVRSAYDEEYFHICEVSPWRFFDRAGTLVIACTLPADVSPNEVANTRIAKVKLDEDLILMRGYLL